MTNACPTVVDAVMYLLSSGMKSFIPQSVGPLLAETPQLPAPSWFALVEENHTQSYHPSRGNTYHIQSLIKVRIYKIPQNHPHS